ncbi:MAG: hypothetical protein OXC13_00315 [Caldilineaceae bacterium]|nr:hypothetical protein [Caldilineaceae bacterium]
MRFWRAIGGPRLPDAWVALMVSVVYRGHAIPVHVLCDQGLGSRDLWRQIVDLG